MTSESETPADAQFDSIDAHWLKRIRQGTTLLFWALLLGPLLPNLIAFVSPIIGVAFRDMGPLWVLHAVCGVPALMGVFLLTTPVPAATASGMTNWIAQLLRAFAIWEVVGRFGSRLPNFKTDGTTSIPVEVVLLIVGFIAVILGLTHLGILSRKLGFGRFGRLLLVFQIAYFLMSGFELSKLLVLIEPDWIHNWKLVLFFVVPNLLIWIWGLVLLRKFRGKVAKILAGRCVHCGYLLKGLPEARCPECGSRFAILTADA